MLTEISKKTHLLTVLFFILRDMVERRSRNRETEEHNYNIHLIPKANIILEIKRILFLIERPPRDSFFV